MIGGGLSGSGEGSGGVPGGGRGVGPCAEPAERISKSEISAPPIVFPIPVTGRLRSLWAADLTGLRCIRSSRTRWSSGTISGRFARLFVHGTNMGGGIVASTTKIGG